MSLSLSTIRGSPAIPITDPQITDIKIRSCDSPTLDYWGKVLVCQAGNTACTALTDDPNKQSLYLITTYQWLQVAVWCTHWGWSLSPGHGFACSYWRCHSQWNTEHHNSTGPWELTLSREREEDRRTRVQGQWHQSSFLQFIHCTSKFVCEQYLYIHLMSMRLWRNSSSSSFFCSWQTP